MLIINTIITLKSMPTISSSALNVILALIRFNYSCGSKRTFYKNQLTSKLVGDKM